MLKKILSIALILCLFSSANHTASASEFITAESDVKVSQEIPVNIAYVQNVNETGTNISDNNKSNATLSLNSSIKVDVHTDDSIIVSVNINGETVTFTGNPVGRSENGKVVFFEGTSSNPSYSIVNFSYDENIQESNMYFKNAGAKSSSDIPSILKIYLKDNNSKTRDYLFIEAFGFNPNYSADFIAKLPQNALLGAWAATQFKPIKTEFGEEKGVVTPMATADVKNFYCTKTFFDMGETQTHTIKWRTNTDYYDVPIGQEARQIYRLTIYEKSMTFSVNTNLNSSTQSYLHVDGLRLCQTSVPYTAWKSTSIDGYVQDNSWGGGTLSARIGVSYGLLGLSYSIPITFTFKGYVDINAAYTGYENNVNGNYSRSIETKMDSNYKLTQLDHYFEVESYLRDYGNAARSSQSLKAKWYVDIINAGTMEVYPLYCDVNVSVAVK